MFRRVPRSAAIACAAIASLVASGDPVSADEGRHFRLPFAGPAVVIQGGWGHDGNPKTFAFDFAPARGDLVIVAAARGTVIDAISDPDNLLRSGSCPPGIRCLQLDSRYCELTGPGGGFGNLVRVDHGDVPGVGKLVSYYAHLARIDVEKGKLVNPGDVIGMAGNSGCSTGTHLHFEVRDLSAGDAKVALCGIEGATWSALCNSTPGDASAFEGKRHLEVGPGATARQMIDPVPLGAAAPAQPAGPIAPPAVPIPVQPFAPARAAGAPPAGSVPVPDLSAAPAVPPCKNTLNPFERGQICDGARLARLALGTVALVGLIALTAWAVPGMFVFGSALLGANALFGAAGAGAVAGAAWCTATNAIDPVRYPLGAIGLGECALDGATKAFAITAGIGIATGVGITSAVGGTVAPALAKIAPVVGKLAVAAHTLDRMAKVATAVRTFAAPKPVYAPTAPIPFRPAPRSPAPPAPKPIPFRPAPPPPAPLVSRVVSAVKSVATAVTNAARAVGKAVGRAVGRFFRR